MDAILTRKQLLSLSLPLAALIATTSSIGLLYPLTYEGSSTDWMLQTLGQDAVDLFLVIPVLIVSSFYSGKGERLGLSVWAGTNFYIVYTFVIYCFDVRFNPLFVFYCIILGLSLFSVSVFLYKIVKDICIVQVSSSTRRLIGYFFIFISVVFYFTWLKDIIPAMIAGEMPVSILGSGLPTNPVHVLDLSILLPLVFVVGVFTLKGNSLALSLTTPLLAFFILMDLTIAALTMIQVNGGIVDGYSVTVVMAIHAALCIGALILLWNKMEFIINARLWNLN